MDLVEFSSDGGMGIHIGLKIQRLRGLRVRVPLGAPNQS